MLTQFIISVYFMYIMSCKYMNLMMIKMFTPSMPFSVYKAIKYYEDNDEICDEKDITKDYYDMKPLDCFMEDKERIEYRVNVYSKVKTKFVPYRVISTKNCEIDPSQSIFVKRQTMGLNYIMDAILYRGDIKTNVTDRVLKFAGPEHNFFNNTHLKMKWMFENDELEEGTSLVLYFKNGSTKAFEKCDHIKIT